MTDTADPIGLYGSLNPLSQERADALARSRERDETLARIKAQRNALSLRSRRLPTRRLVAALAVAVALAVPALAFSGGLRSLFTFSNQGTPVPHVDQRIVTTISKVTGASANSVTELASRNGWTFYKAQKPGDVCYWIQPPAQSESDGISNQPGGDCKNLAGDADFPSPSRPIFNMSHYLGPDQNGHMSIVTLTGVAADGIASIQVLALSDCHVIAQAPVINNVYVADNLPLTPESQVVARDTNGNVVWHQAVGAAVEPAPAANSCGLN